MEWKVAPSYSHARILEVNEETRKAHIFETCPKCGGTGQYLHFGMCYWCQGARGRTKWVKAYTPEEFDKYVSNQEKAKARREAKAKARFEENENKSEENKNIWLVKNNFDPLDPAIYIVFGNTYEIKEVLKERGGRFNPALNWHFRKPTEVPEGYQTVKVPFDSVYNWYPQQKYAEYKDLDELEKVYNAAKKEVIPETSSEYIGEVKERLRDMRVKLTGCRAISTLYGESIVFTFDFDGNTLTWFTSTVPDEDKTIVGNEYILTGTVKKHDLYNGVKTTYLNRCIIKTI